MAKIWVTRIDRSVYVNRTKPKVVSETGLWGDKYHYVNPVPKWDMCYAGWIRSVKAKLKNNTPTQFKIVRI